MWQWSARRDVVRQPSRQVGRRASLSLNSELETRSSIPQDLSAYPKDRVQLLYANLIRETDSINRSPLEARRQYGAQYLQSHHYARLDQPRPCLRELPTPLPQHFHYESLRSRCCLQLSQSRVCPWPLGCAHISHSSRSRMAQKSTISTQRKRQVWRLPDCT